MNYSLTHFLHLHSAAGPNTCTTQHYKTSMLHPIPGNGAPGRALKALDRSAPCFWVRARRVPKRKDQHLRIMAAASPTRPSNQCVTFLENIFNYAIQPYLIIHRLRNHPSGDPRILVDFPPLLRLQPDPAFRPLLTKEPLPLTQYQPPGNQVMYLASRHRFLRSELVMPLSLTGFANSSGRGYDFDCNIRSPQPGGLVRRRSPTGTRFCGLPAVVPTVHNLPRRRLEGGLFMGSRFSQSV